MHSAMENNRQDHKGTIIVSPWKEDEHNMVGHEMIALFIIFGLLLSVIWGGLTAWRMGEAEVTDGGKPAWWKRRRTWRMSQPVSRWTLHATTIQTAETRGPRRPKKAVPRNSQDEQWGLHPFPQGNWQEAQPTARGLIGPLQTDDIMLIKDDFNHVRKADWTLPYLLSSYLSILCFPDLVEFQQQNLSTRRKPSQSDASLTVAVGRAGGGGVFLYCTHRKEK